MKINLSNSQRKYNVSKEWLELYIPRIFNITLNEILSVKKNKIYRKYIKDSFSISFYLVSQTKIKALNNKFRNKNSETDVLSFNLIDLNEEFVFQFDDIVFGEIFICLDKAIMQASQYNHSLEREILFLTVHGILHLFGYDHQSPKDEKLMFDLQNLILNSAKITRDFNSDFKLLKL